MHPTFRINLISVPTYVAASVLLSVAFLSVGGIDVGRYWSISSLIDVSQPHFIEEFISWSIIGFVGKLSSRETFTGWIALITLASAIAFSGHRRGLVIYAAFMSPFGFLLQLNILRQSISTVFICISIAFIIEKRLWPAMIFGIAAVFSHNSAIIIIALCFSVYLFTASQLKGKIVVVSIGAIISTFALAIFDISGFSSDFSSKYSAVSLEGIENALYVVYFALLCIPLFFIKVQTIVRNIMLGFLGMLILMFSVCTALGVDTWVYGRLAITANVVGTFLWLKSFQDGLNWRAGLWGSIILLVAGFLLAVVHPGVRSMIVGGGAIT